MNPDLKQIRAVVLDIADAGASYQRQDEVSDFIWNLLGQNYQIYLCSSNPRNDLGGEEDFEHPRLVFLREEMPPSVKLVETHLPLGDPATLWVTNEPLLQRWIARAGMPFIGVGPAKAATPEPVPWIAHLSDLGALLHPTGFVLDEALRRVTGLRSGKPAGPLLVGVGGPPQSGYQQFALDLRGRLQDADFPLVELLDLSLLLASCDELLRREPAAGGPWVSPAAGAWVAESVLAPLRQGNPVYQERLPAGLPADFAAHFPLFISRDSVLLVFAELLFTPAVSDHLDLAILLEVSPEELTRRLYEIPSGERIDPRFTDQFLVREGHIYQEYLRANRVVEHAALRVDANHPHAFHFSTEPGPPLV
jgi:hypothetical protein